MQFPICYITQYSPFCTSNGYIYYIKTFNKCAASNWFCSIEKFKVHFVTLKVRTWAILNLYLECFLVHVGVVLFCFLSLYFFMTWSTRTTREIEWTRRDPYDCLMFARFSPKGFFVGASLHTIPGFLCDAHEVLESMIIALHCNAFSKNWPCSNPMYAHG